MPKLESNNGNPYHKSTYAKQILNQDSNETKIITLGWSKGKIHSEAVARCSVKKVFLNISQNSKKNICAKVSFSIKLKALGLKKRVSRAGVFL